MCEGLNVVRELYGLQRGPDPSTRSEIGHFVFESYITLCRSLAENIDRGDRARSNGLFGPLESLKRAFFA